MLRKISISLTLMLAVLTISCSVNGPEERMKTSGATLEGVVYYGDTPVANAMVIVSISGPGATASTALSDDDGRYKVDNAPIGKVSIGVNSDAGKGMAIGKAMAGTNPTEKGSKKATVGKVIDVPKKFHDPANSGLSTEVKSGENKFDIKIPK